MPISFTDHFGINRDCFARTGAFDAILDTDSQVFIDPSTLALATTQELRGTEQLLAHYFDGILRLVAASTRKGDLMWTTAGARLQFREVGAMCIGYAKRGTAGSGIGPNLRAELLDTASQIVAAGIQDPAIFELVGLFQEGIGPDRVSDMVGRIISARLLAFTARVIEACAPADPQALIAVEAGGARWTTVRNPFNRLPLVLIPSEILRPLPLALDWDGVELAVLHNAQLRARLNRLIGMRWRDLIRSYGKRGLKQLLLDNPDLLRSLLAAYHERDRRSYDWNEDPKGVHRWYHDGFIAAQSFPLALQTPQPGIEPDLLSLTFQIVDRFADLIETKGLNRNLYYEGKPLPERYAQGLFHTTADCWCRAADVDLSCEANRGRGPVDFKLSRGNAKIVVEVKLLTNQDLIHGYTHQLPIYQAAEDASGIYLVIINTESGAAHKRLAELHALAGASGERAPRVRIIDGLVYPSASRA